MPFARITLDQIAYKSEWALAKFFDSCFNNDSIKEKFMLRSICGREKTKEDALEALITSAQKKVEILEKTHHSKSPQRFTEVRNLLNLMRALSSNIIQYHFLNGGGTLPPKNSNYNALVIHSSNKSHINYIQQGIDLGEHILCEKPLIPVIDAFGRPDDSGINQLENIIKKAPKNLVFMDAEHYSYKEPALVFYQMLNECLEGKKIKRVEGEIREFDDPSWDRTKDILNLHKSQTGLMGDTLCHLIAFISNLGGQAVPVSREYANYDKNGVTYDVDTYDKVDYSIKNIFGNYFSKEASASFVVAKFIDKMKTQNTEESKYIKFILEDNSEITIDFRKKTVEKKKNGHKWLVTSQDKGINSNEYVNILNQFYDSIINEAKLRTNFTNSLTTLRSIHDAYALSPDKNIMVEVYT